MLNMLELLDISRMGPPTESPETLYYMERVAGIVKDEAPRTPDPATRSVPLSTIESKEYARIRMELLKMGTSAPERATVPAAQPGSCEVTVVDSQGNVATLFHSCKALPWQNGLFCEGVTICAGGAHFLRLMPGPGERATCVVAPNIIFRDGRPVLTSGSPSVSLNENILQNTVNILDFGIPIDESVERPRFGGRHPDGGTMIEADLDESVRTAAEKLGSRWDVVGPWQYNLGSFEGVSIDQRTGELSACADPRRAGGAMGV
jgi:gamma-glutamyltranspeptidase/glutathione hydrolase